MLRPTFIIVGAPKSGTTALSHFLDCHPQVFISRPKEPHFFDGHYNKGINAYLRDHFSNWRQEQAAGEATPSYLLIPYVPSRIRHHLPDARLIAILRHPIDRAYSSWWMFRSRGMEPLTFEDAIHENEQRLASGLCLDERSEAAWREHVTALEKGSRIKIRTYLDSGYYAQHLQRYFALFPREQIRIVLSEDLRNDPRQLMSELYSFIGIAENFEMTDYVTINAAFGAGSRPILQAARITGAVRLRRLLPLPVTSWLKRQLSSLGKRPAISPSTRAYLLEHFAPHTSALEGLLNIKLDSWKE